jgi:Ran-binding protein 1
MFNNNCYFLLTGDVKLLKHKETEKIRLLMRRDKTWKICANHYIEPWMILKPMSSDRTWMWLVHSDFAGSNPDNNKRIKKIFLRDT